MYSVGLLYIYAIRAHWSGVAMTQLIVETVCLTYIPLKAVALIVHSGIATTKW